jgi:hypothetical protein
MFVPAALVWGSGALQACVHTCLLPLLTGASIAGPLDNPTPLPGQTLGVSALACMHMQYCWLLTS